MTNKPICPGTREGREAEAKARLIGLALRLAFGDNAGPYEDDSMRFGVCFADGSMVDVIVVANGAGER